MIFKQSILFLFMTFLQQLGGFGCNYSLIELRISGVECITSLFNRISEYY